MAWTTFPHLIDGQIFTGAHAQIIEGNFAETAPAKFTTAGQMFIATGANAGAARTPTAALVVTTQTTSSTSYTNLATSGPAVTVTTGTRAICLFAVDMTNNTIGHYSATSIDVSSATTIAATDATSIRFEPGTANGVSRIGCFASFSPETSNALTAGSNIFTLKYRVQAGTDTGTFTHRHLTVIPL